MVRTLYGNMMAESVSIYYTYSTVFFLFGCSFITCGYIIQIFFLDSFFFCEFCSYSRNVMVVQSIRISIIIMKYCLEKRIMFTIHTYYIWILKLERVFKNLVHMRLIFVKYF